MDTKPSNTRTLPPRIRPCPDCGTMTRSSKMTITEAPGTLVRQAGGKCSRCYRRPVAHRRPGETVASHESNKASLDAYFANRRRRGVPAEGLRDAS